jgi:iron complex transport system substrate-binding protein
MYGTEDLGRIAFETGLAIHRDVGPGLLETAYEKILTEKLRANGLHVDRQVPIDLVYDGIEVKEAYRIDLIVQNALLIEVKATEATLPVYSRQVLTYLKFSGLTLGFVMNFGMATFKDGVRRLVRDHPTSYSSSRLRANHSDGAAG